MKKIFAIAMFLPVVVNAEMVNITVDDMDTAITYKPFDAWSEGQSCHMCTAKLEKHRTYQSTWHDTTFFPGKSQGLYAEFNFTGVGVYVYCILSNSVNGSIPSTSDMTFLVDGVLSNEFYQEADPLGPKFAYNVSVFANTSFADGEHTLVIRNGRPGGGEAIILLDSIVYTQNQEVNNQNQTEEVGSRKDGEIGGIIGGTLGGLGCLVLIVCGWIFFTRRRRGGFNEPHVVPWDGGSESQDPPAYREMEGGLNRKGRS